MNSYQLHVGRCEAVLKTMPDNSVDAIVTDPPYGLSFMGHKWDYQVPTVEQWAECLRVLKPGGHLLAFGGSRTYHRQRARVKGVFHHDSGSAARFFYCAKVTPAERDEGMERFIAFSASEMTGGRKEGSAGLNDPRAGAGRSGGAKNPHPTVKPIALMKYLCRLITPPGGTILDPFTGSGSTGRAAIEEGFGFIGIDLDPDNIVTASARIGYSYKQMSTPAATICQNSALPAISRSLNPI